MTVWNLFRGFLQRKFIKNVDVMKKLNIIICFSQAHLIISHVHMQYKKYIM